MSLKKLYALLVILIVIYIGINLAAGGLGLTDTQTADNAVNDADNSNSISIGDSNMPKLDGFTTDKVNDTTVSYKDANNMTIYVTALDNSNDIFDIASGAYSNNAFTSNQTIDQNGVPVYFLYNEGTDSYGTNIYFNKDNQNYMITGSEISYENSDNFINSCKSIIDSISSSGSDNGNGLSRF